MSELVEESKEVRNGWGRGVTKADQNIGLSRDSVQETLHWITY
jgi:hypothetical protein